MRTKRLRCSKPGITLIFDDQDREVGTVYHHRKNDHALHMNGWYWRDGKANQRSGSSGTCFPSSQAAIAAAEDLLKHPPDESMHVAANDGVTLDQLIKQLQALRSTVPGNMLVAVRNPSAHGFLNGLSKGISPKRVQAKPHYDGFVETEALGTGVRKRFIEPYQSQIEARGAVPVVVLW
ncbi:hypothetical protein [Nevskia ramosa]|uniref:hypothetical protein n=1 Tax=Nevskia ramosa TaxID=64002 RepID=UPI002356BAF2|nr:hypothetical protein [Nevskia ramosa]